MSVRMVMNCVGLGGSPVGHVHVNLIHHHASEQHQRQQKYGEQAAVDVRGYLHLSVWWN
jgi:hypothetical protein